MSDFAPDYVDVAERLRLLRDKYPDASLQGTFEIADVNGTTHVIYRAECYRTPDDARPGVGYAWEQVPGKTPFTRASELMNAETSAWGRAIVAALAAETKRVASADEMRRSDALEYASTDHLNHIGTALRKIADTELRARVKAQVTARWGGPDQTLASDVADILAYITRERDASRPFDLPAHGNGDGLAGSAGEVAAGRLSPVDSGVEDVRVTEALAHPT